MPFVAGSDRYFGTVFCSSEPPGPLGRQLIELTGVARLRYPRVKLLLEFTALVRLGKYDAELKALQSIIEYADARVL